MVGKTIVAKFLALSLLLLQPEKEERNN